VRNKYLRTIGKWSFYILLVYLVASWLGYQVRHPHDNQVTFFTRFMDVILWR